MKITENVTVYRCDHCSKKYFAKHACEKHEQQCTHNPANIPACLMCVHCESKIKEVVYSGFYNGNIIENTVQANSFYCKKKEQGMYPVKAVWKGLLDKYPETFKGEILMPTECEQHQFTQHGF